MRSHAPLQLERGLVAAVVQDTERGRDLLVEVQGELERAWHEQGLGPAAEVGDTVLLNTTAVRLALGTGGVHFVVAVEGKAQQQSHEHEQLTADEGHIMKLRYTPLQRRVQAVEEPSHPAHRVMQQAQTLAGLPVVICELHSQLPAVAMTVKELAPEARIAYVMTDGGALPLALSHTVAKLRELEMLAGTVTVGHAYGGDFEAVNLYSGLLAARHVVAADVIIVAIGPGVVGTGTRFGHTGIEVGTAVNAVHALAGLPVVVPRLSFADGRDRHRGVSHHTLTALGTVALAEAVVPLPELPAEQAAQVWEQLTAAGLHRKHRFVGVSGARLLDAMQRFPVPLKSMGRTVDQDRAFFLAAGAAGEWVAQFASQPASSTQKHPASR